MKTMHNELIHLGPITIYGYGLMIAIGVLLAYRVLAYRAEKQRFALNHVTALTMWSLLGGAAGAKLLYWMTIIPDIRNNPRILLDFSQGFVVYGGIVGGLLAGYMYCRRNNLKFLQYADLFVPSVALAQGFGRIGCFLAGCCYGEETHHWYGVTFHDSAYAPNGVPLVPTQLLESALNFGLFFLLIRWGRGAKADGLIAGIYLTLYALGRFLIEFVRGDVVRGHVGVLSTSQWIALGMVALAGLILFIQLRDRKGASAARS
ncbi:prolipoprotein diacylglyceryl transferase [Paenibacillus methanolicus]|uniref:Phosphatidylglycerol--prolipoprotein diacylglyceryl transferase n=1 Tax=Paenibacillus methanolicus TaxID=582686 RepID=A0A5S5BWT0_9BACL|nr:prolipoprotein diacylglyceryl transferase [Paenibacillus methanolicus]TYP70600.1 phosphatidylglycerol:prolipoprotein diacylglycerol transferase [Paenibacillus methanolicus]